MARSKNQVKRKYNRIDPNHGSEGRNIYECKKGHYICTTHIDKGVTPFLIECPTCKSHATSWMYMVSDEGNILHIRSKKIIIPTIFRKWIRPPLDWVIKKNKKRRYEHFVEHVLSGGLLFEEDVIQL